MSNPRLRIVLVDNENTRRMDIEKTMSSIGYHRILPVSSALELIKLLENSAVTFDLLIINKEIMQSSGTRLDLILQNYSCVKHVLFYKSAELRAIIDASTFNPECHFIAKGTPDRLVLAQVMNYIDCCR